MKTQSYGVVRWAGDALLPLQCLFRTGGAWRDYTKQRANGDKQDSPKAAFPDWTDIPDSACSWASEDGQRKLAKVERAKNPDWFIVPKSVQYKKSGKWCATLRGDETPAMRRWMEQRDVNYLCRLAREGKLYQTEPKWEEEVSAWVLNQAKQDPKVKSVMRANGSKNVAPLRPKKAPQQQTILTEVKEDKQSSAPSAGFDRLSLSGSLDIIPASQLVYREEDVLGEGSFGTVYKGKWQHLGEEVAIKRLKAQDLPDKDWREFKQEVEIMANLKHTNIAILYGICLERRKLSLVMEYFPKLSLFHLLRSSDKLPWQLRWSLAMDISRGLSYLHYKKVLHRDLKSLNVLITDRGRAKLTDFGLSKVKTLSASTSTMSKGQVGTLRWMAPELFKRRARHTAASDVYSLGMVLWELASRKTPFSDQPDNTIVMKWIADGEKEDIPAECQKDHAQFAALILLCWGAADKRPTASQMVEKLQALKDQYQSDLFTSGRSVKSSAPAASSGFLSPSFQPS